MSIEVNRKRAKWTFKLVEGGKILFLEERNILWFSGDYLVEP